LDAVLLLGVKLQFRVGDKEGVCFSSLFPAGRTDLQGLGDGGSGGVMRERCRCSRKVCYNARPWPDLPLLAAASSIHPLICKSEKGKPVMTPRTTTEVFTRR